MKNADYPRNIIKELSGFTVAEIPENFFDRFYRLLNDALTEREKEMLVMYYSTDKTFAEIGQQYGLSEQRVQKIIKKAIQKVRVQVEWNLNFFRMLESKENKNRFAYESERFKWNTEGYEAGYKQGYYNAMQGKETKRVTIAEMGLSTYTENALKRSGIEDLSQLIAAGQDKVKNIRNIGKKSFEEIADVLIQEYDQSVLDWKWK